MHDLEALIAEWRRSLQPELGKDAADELEDHLREKVADFCERGIELERAFKLAKFELGPGDSIAAEFRKIDAGMWWPLGFAMVAVGLCATICIGWVIKMVLNGATDPILAAHFVAIVTGYFTALMCGAAGGAFVLQRSFVEIPAQKLEGIVRHTTRLLAITAMLTAVGIILGVIWSDAVLHTYWQWDPRRVGPLCVLAWSIFVVAMAQSIKASARVVMMFAIFGNIVVSVAWFAPFLFTNSYHPGLKALLCALVAIHLLLLAIATLPVRWVRILRESA